MRKTPLVNAGQVITHRTAVVQHSWSHQGHSSGLHWQYALSQGESSHWTPYGSWQLEAPPPKERPFFKRINAQSQRARVLQIAPTLFITQIRLAPAGLSTIICTIRLLVAVKIVHGRGHFASRCDSRTAAYCPSGIQGILRDTIHP